MADSQKELVIGSRGSVLALWQAEYIKSRLKDECGLESRIQIVKTRGDKILDVPLAKIGGKGLFTKELEEMLLSGEIDLAVHSLKDVPVEFVSGLGLVAITEREDPSDCFVSVKYPNLESLPQGAKVGTTSLRRSMQ
ncbi:hydroxymethylbilane synthase, partial [Helicobacter typhlonius]